MLKYHATLEAIYSERDLNGKRKAPKTTAINFAPGRAVAVLGVSPRTAEHQLEVARYHAPAAAGSFTITARFPDADLTSTTIHVQYFRSVTEGQWRVKA